jgi:hypothetical protein
MIYLAILFYIRICINYCILKLVTEIEPFRNTVLLSNETEISKKCLIGLDLANSRYSYFGTYVFCFNSGQKYLNFSNRFYGLWRVREKRLFIEKRGNINGFSKHYRLAVWVCFWVYRWWVNILWGPFWVLWGSVWGFLSLSAFVHAVAF